MFLESIHELTARFDVPYQYLGKLRVDDVMISGTDWRPEIPDVETIYRDLQELNRIECITDRALSIGLTLCVHRCSRTEIRESVRLQPIKYL